MTAKCIADPSAMIRIPLSIFRNENKPGAPLSVESPAKGALVFLFGKESSPVTFAYPLPKGGEHSHTGLDHTIDLRSYSRVQEAVDDTLAEVGSASAHPELPSDYVLTVKNTGKESSLPLRINYSTGPLVGGRPQLSSLDLEFPFSGTEHCLHIIKSQTETDSSKGLRYNPYEIRLTLQAQRDSHNAGAATTFCAESEP